MFFIKVFSLLLALSAILGIPSIALAQCSKTMVIGWEDFPPYSLKDASGNRAGLDIELATAVLKKAGCSYTFQDATWKRLLEEVRNGRIDILAGASRTVAREKFAQFSTPYRQEIMSIFMRRGETDKIRLTRLADLQNYRLSIATVLGTWYGQEYEVYSKHPPVQNSILHIAKNENPFRMLRQNRVDMVFADYYSGHAEATGIAPSSWFDVHNYLLNKSTVHLMLSRASTTAADLKNINRAAQDLLQTGQLQSIVRRYGFEPQKVLYDPVHTQ